MKQSIKTQQYKWDNVAIGGGGYATGIIQHPLEGDLVYVRTDVGGVYRWDAHNKSWIQLLDHLGLDERNLYGVDGFAIDPSDPDIIYIAAGKYAKSELSTYYAKAELCAEPCDVYKSKDRGKSWIRTNLNKDFRANLDIRWIGECIAVDPNNSDIVYCGTRNDGLWRTTNATGEITWEKVEGVPNGTWGLGVRNIMFDPYSLSDGASQTIYAGVFNEGLYKTSDGGNAWDKMEGCPNTVNRMAIAGDGVLYVTAGYLDKEFTTPEKGVFKYKNKTWYDITPDKVYKEYCGIATDINNPERLICSVHFNGFWNPLYLSSDAGETWKYVFEDCRRNNDVPWWTSCYFGAATSSVMMDANKPNKVWMTDWYGIWVTEDITQSPSIWNSYTKGYESMVSFTAVCPPKGAFLLTGIADNDGMRHTDLSKFPEKKLGTPYLQETTGMDFCESNPNFIARVGSWEWGKNGCGGYSIDNGITWKKIKSWPFGANGKIAVSSTQESNFVVVPIGDTPKYTMDYGANWHECEEAPKNCVKEFWSWNHPIASDRVNGSIYYLYNEGNFYVSRDSGKKWEATVSLPKEEWHNVKAVPGCQGEVWVSLDDFGIFSSKDFGKSFNKLLNIEKAYLFAFGKNPDGQKYPAVFLYGKVKGMEGIFRSDDMGESWIKINTDRERMGNDPNCMEGDRQVFGRVYLGTNGRGYYYGQPV